MCCFAGPVVSVRNTNIFGRLTGQGSQFLVYQMEFASRSENAMILPLPTALPARENAVRFVDLRDYGTFFQDLAAGFPAKPSFSLGRSKSATATAAPVPSLLEVHEVGDYVASFVPSIQDFVRLDPKFRIAPETWAKIPTYRDYGFAVFQLKSRGGSPHPMAFEFDTRLTAETFFPTVHIHDGEVHASEHFDHALYVQDARFDAVVAGYDDHDTLDHATELVRSDRTASDLMNMPRTQGIVDPALLVHRKDIRGTHENADILLSLSQASVSRAQARTWGLRIGPAAIGVGALAWIIARRNRLRGNAK